MTVGGDVFIWWRVRLDTRLTESTLFLLKELPKDPLASESFRPGRVLSFGAVIYLRGLSTSSPGAHVRDLRIFRPKVARLARLVSRKSQRFVTHPTFGIRTRKVARASNLVAKKA